MARVRQRGTAAERAVAGVLRELGCHWRANVRTLPGSPDFANRKRKWAIFVHGCFWHQHRGCGRATVPKQRREFWLDKFAANRKRDARAARLLRAQGFEVIVVWECQSERPAALRRRLAKILEARRV